MHDVVRSMQQRWPTATVDQRGRARGVEPLRALGYHARRNGRTGRHPTRAASGTREADMVSEELAGFTRAQRIWARLGVAVFFLIVGGSAATQSFKHIYDVALIAHQTTLVAFLMPLSI